MIRIARPVPAVAGFENDLFVGGSVGRAAEERER